MSTAIVTPIDGWGFFEAVDRQLATTFDVDVTQGGADIGSGILGWRGVAINGKYAGAAVEMTPRNKPWSGTVVIRVRHGEAMIFNGMAHTSGLEHNW